MKRLMIVTAFAALAACSQQPAPPAQDANLAVENEVAPAPAAAALYETTWEFTQDGKALQESIDATGNYIPTAGTEVVDHGTAVQKDGKACFTSAVKKEGEDCWADPVLEIGESGETTSDKGKKLTIKRVAYVPKTK